MASTWSGIRRRAVAVIAALGLTLTGVAVALPASAESANDGDTPAAAPVTDVSVVSANAEDGLTVRVTGENYVDLPNNAGGGPATGVYVSLRDAAVADEDLESQALTTDFVFNARIVDGKFSSELSAATDDLDPDASYEVIIWSAHGNVTEDSTIFTAEVPLTQAHRDALFPVDDSDDGTGAEDGGDAGSEDGAEDGDDSGTEDGEDAGTEDGDDTGADNGDDDTATWTPELAVYRADGVTPVGDTVLREGDTIVVKGSGFDPHANVPAGAGRPPLGDLPQGIYTVFGHFAETWQPSAGAASSTRMNMGQTWVLAEDILDQVDTRFQGMVRDQWTELNTEDGTFTWTIELKDPEEPQADGRYGIYTYPAGSSVNADQELAVLLNYEETPRPRLHVYLEDGVTPVGDTLLREGDTVVVKGTGFDPYANLPDDPNGGVPIPNSLPQGTFAVFGNFAEEWQPSEGAPSSNRKINTAARTWLLAEDTVNEIPAQFQDTIRRDWTELDPADGSFTWVATLNAPTDTLENGRFGIYTYAAGAGVVDNPAHELEVLLNFQADTDDTDDGDEQDLRTTVDVTGADAEGLKVQVSGSNYVDLPRASSGAPASGVYVALRDKAISYDEINADTSLVADIAFIHSGQIRDGEFTANLEAAAADLSADAQYEVFVWVAHGNITPDTVVFAEDLVLTEGQREDLFGSTGGQPAPGDEDDGDTTPGDGDQPAKPSGKVKYAKVDLGGDRDQTVTATGFTPGETVAIALHSKVFNLGQATATSKGEVVFDFKVPAATEPGQHKVVLTGLDSRVTVEVPFEVTGSATTTPVIRCVEETIPARAGVPTLRWGVKSSFVSYVEGGIAKGSVSTGNGASRSGGAISWGSGSGSFNDAGIGTLSFPGTFRASGHDGVLNLAISNLQVRSTGGNSGVLVGYVRSQNMSGETVANGTVTIANLSFRSLSAKGGTASATLTAAGARAFAGFYNAGDALDSLTISITGAQGEQTVEVCYDEDGNRVNADGTPYTGDGLAVTGAGSSGLIALTGALTLIGSALLVTRRIRARGA